MRSVHCLQACARVCTQTLRMPHRISCLTRVCYLRLIVRLIAAVVVVGGCVCFFTAVSLLI